MSITKTKKKIKSSNKKSLSSGKTPSKSSFIYSSDTLQPGGRGQMINSGCTPTITTGGSST